MRRPAHSLRHADLALVPGRGQVAELRVFPAWMGVDRLAIVLHVVVDSRPAARHFEIAPAAGRHRIGLLGRLPPPQAVDANPLAGGRRLAVRLLQVPDGPDAVGQRGVVRGRSRAGRTHRQTNSQTRQTILLFIHFRFKPFHDRLPICWKQLIALNRHLRIARGEPRGNRGRCSGQESCKVVGWDQIA